MSDPFKHLIISRKRKKYKFAHFDSYPNCFNFTDKEEANVKPTLLWKFLDLKKPLVVELAAGNGQFSMELARRHPDKNFVAVDIKSDRLYSSARKAVEDALDNLAFVRLRIDDINQLFKDRIVDELWLTFPDPHPKKRSAKHRLTHPKYLAMYETMLKRGAKLHYKTDNLPLFQWSLEQFVATGWQLSELSFDLHDSDLAGDYKIKTYYEERFTEQGIPTNYCTAARA